VIKEGKFDTWTTMEPRLLSTAAARIKPYGEFTGACLHGRGSPDYFEGTRSANRRDPFWGLQSSLVLTGLDIMMLVVS